MSVWEALFHPRSSDGSLLARFYRANVELSNVSENLNKVPAQSDDRRLREALQAFRKARLELMNLILKIMDNYIPQKRHKREFRMKFPDEVIENGLEAQIWYGAECLAGGNIIPTREAETESLRPMARLVVDTMQHLRTRLHRDACAMMRRTNRLSDDTVLALERADQVLADFELSYVSVLVSVKSLTEMDQLQHLAAFFCHVAQWAVDRGLLQLEQIEDADPGTLIALPRLVVFAGLHLFPDSPLNPDNAHSPAAGQQHRRMHAMFRRFQRQLVRLRDSLHRAGQEEIESLLLDITASTGSALPAPAGPDLGLEEKDTEKEKKEKEEKEEKEKEEKEEKEEKAEEEVQTEIVHEVTSAPSKKEASNFDRQAAFKLIALIADCQATNAAWEMRFLLRAVHRVLTSPIPSLESDIGATKETPGPPPQPPPSSADGASGSSGGTTPTEVAVDALQWGCEEVNDAEAGSQSSLPAEWVPDANSATCMFCDLPFTLFRRRHHCRACGRLLCAACTPHQRMVRAVDKSKPVRVCNYCVIFRLPPEPSCPSSTS